MTTETQELQAIHMSIQTADLNMIGFSCDESITLSCGLMNIGRGICSVTIKPSLGAVPLHRGSLNIEIGRKHLMQTCISLLMKFMMSIQCGLFPKKALQKKI